MKRMTCEQLGGPCDFTHEGETADEIIKAQDHHLKEMIAAGEASHGRARAEMKGRWRRPISGMRWYMSMKAQFAAAPDV
jgi:predicted small metal-binding protein